MPTLPNRGRGRGAPLAAIGLLLSSTLALAPTAAAAGLTLTTPYPSVVVAPGSTVGFDIAVVSNPNQQVALGVSGVPAEWTATLRGGGYVVNGVQTDDTWQGHRPPRARDPGHATDGTAKVSVNATAGGLRATLPLTHPGERSSRRRRDPDQRRPLAAAARRARASPSTSPCSNDSAEDLTFAVTAVGPRAGR